MQPSDLDRFPVPSVVLEALPENLRTAWLIAHEPVGQGTVWWRPDGNGYTNNVLEAGIYSRERALRQEQARDRDFAYPLPWLLYGKGWNMNGSVGEALTKTPPMFPRRGDVDWHEATDTPVFLIQRRRFAPIDLSGLDYDSDTEQLKDAWGNEITEDKAVELELARWEWDTDRVEFTREKAQAWCDARSYNGPWRVYSVPAIGQLRSILRILTDKEERPSG